MAPCWTTPYEREALWTSVERKNHHLPQMRCDFSQWCSNDSCPVSYQFIGIGNVSEKSMASDAFDRQQRQLEIGYMAVLVMNGVVGM